jgi:Transposase, Mutator family
MGYLIVSQGILVVCAVRQTDGLLEILAVEVADTESEATYQEMFRLLKEVGFCRVELVVSYDHEGLKAVGSPLPGSISPGVPSVHYSRNHLGMVGAARRKDLGGARRRLRGGDDHGAVKQGSGLEPPPTALMAVIAPSSASSPDPSPVRSPSTRGSARSTQKEAGNTPA